MKVAYEKVYAEWTSSYVKRELTGRCMKRTGGPYKEAKYYEVRWFFGLLTRWVREDDIEFYDPETVTYYECKCDEK